MELMEGRPQNTEGRQERELRAYDLLDSLGIVYHRVDHAPAMTMEDCRAADEAMGTPMCKNLLLCNRQKTDFYLLMLPGDKPFRTAELSRKIGSSRLSFAGGEYMEQFLDITPGSLSVLGLMNDKEKRVQLLIDREVIDAPFVGCHPCVNTASLRIRTRDLLERILPAIGHEPRLVELERM